MKPSKIFSYLFCLLFLVFFQFGKSQNNVTVTDVSSHEAHVSAMLDVFSTTKGMLVPRLNSIQMGAISDPATGLLIYNSDTNSFHFFNGLLWINLSTATESIWSVNPVSGDVFLDNLGSNIGIGTSEPGGKLSVSADIDANPDEPLFEIKDEFGIPIFSVTSEGVRVFVKESTGKGVSGGFAVGRYGAVKGIPDTTFLLVTPDSTRIYINDNRKAVSGGFSVGRYGAVKENTNFMHLNGNNTFLGEGAGSNVQDGDFNIFIGYHSGENSGGSDNIFIGNNSGVNNAESDKLVISNNSSLPGSPLIWGDFATKNLVINGTNEDNIENSTLYVNGSAGGNTVWANLSDKRLKKNIETIPNALDKVLNIRGVNYEWKDTENFSEGKKMGFIAQEVNSIIPEVVNNNNKQYSMEYSSITAVLVEAVKEQQIMIDELKSDNNELKEQIDEIKALLEKK